MSLEQTPLAAGSYLIRPLKLLPTRMQGWDVYALQTALDIKPDGVFGEITDGAVRACQEQNKLLPVDGIAGPNTKTAAVLDRMFPLQSKYHTPPGLARGVVGGETNFEPGSYTAPYRNGTRDIGIVQENGVETFANLLESFDVPGALERMISALRARFDAALGESKYVAEPMGAWRYGAVLAHNWPAASKRYIDGTIKTWSYVATFDRKDPRKDGGTFVKDLGDGRHEQRRYKMDTPAQWVMRIGVAGVVTGFQWAEHYIDTKTVFVKRWA